MKLNSVSRSLYFVSDLSAEVKTLVDKHIANHNKNGNIWYLELGKDLVNYVSRPDFLIEAVHYMRTFGVKFLYFVVVEFLQSITDSQIKTILELKHGVIFFDEVQGWLQTSAVPFNFDWADAGKLRQLYMKIERVRIPIISNDPRPYIGDMVGANEDMGIDPSIISPRAPFYHYRFGGGHDGEHWLTNSVGAQVKATAGIKGVVLTYFKQEAERGSGQLYNVMILLDKSNIVLLIKDFVTINPKIIKQGLFTSPDNSKTIKNETMFINKTDKPIKSVRLDAGDFIGTTTNWNKLGAAKYFPEYNREFGTFHFSFLKYEFAQDFRIKKSLKGDISIDQNIATNPYSKDTRIPKDWFIAPCSSESPVKCFK